MAELIAGPTFQGLAGIVADADEMTEAHILFETPAWAALLKWLEFHGIDPRKIPAGTRLSRDACGRCIRYVRIVENERGELRVNRDPRDPFWMTEPAVEQGEAPPLPYPPEVAELLRPRSAAGPGPQAPDIDPEAAAPPARGAGPHAPSARASSSGPHSSPARPAHRTPSSSSPDDRTGRAANG